MKIKHTICAVLATSMLAGAESQAQPMSDTSTQKLFTLEDLSYGGTNYKQMQPERRDYRWWGNTLVRADGELLYEVSEKNGTERKLSEKQHKAYDEWKAHRKGNAEVRDDNLYVGDRQLTTDGSREIVYGKAVHRNEWGINGGLFWSPRHRRLAFYRMDQSMVADYPQVDIFKRIATCEPDKYPMAGEASHVVTVGVFDTETRNTVYLKTQRASSDYNPVYFTNIAWSPDEQTVYMFELNREQNDCRLVSYDATTGERLAELYRETSDKYVEPLNPIAFLPWDDTKFVLQSRKDNYNHLYLASVNDASSPQPITRGDWNVMELIGFCPEARAIVYAGNEQSPIQKNLYAVNVDTGERTLLDNGCGWHEGKLSEDGTRLIDTYQEPDVPRGVNLVSLGIDRSSHRLRPANRNLLTAADPWAGYAVPRFESGTIKAADNATTLYYRMVKPADFDPSKKYSTVVYVYGGPHAHLVEASWHYGSRTWETYMAQKGYIVFVLDNRGSENRSLAFEQSTFHHLGQVEMADQMRGVDYLRSLPYVDMERLGVHGWSYGGFMTISLITNYPDVFRVGVAGGPVIDWKWYEVMYGERYMGTPQSNPDGYAQTSLLAKAKNLKGRLQIITGYNDATVVPQHCLSFIAECIKAGTQPDLFVYPGQEHGVKGHQNVHLQERITQYFENHLK